MQLTFPNEALDRHVMTSSAGLHLVGRAVSTRTTLPVPRRRPPPADPGGLTLRATDMEMSLTREVSDLEIAEPGSVLLPARLFGDVARSLPDGNVDARLPRGRARRGADGRRRAVPPEDARTPRTSRSCPDVEGDGATLPGEPSSPR